MTGFHRNLRGLTLFLILFGLWALHQIGRHLDPVFGPVSLSLAAPIMGGLVLGGFAAWRFVQTRKLFLAVAMAPNLQYGHFDFLTKLPNRVLLQDRLATLAARARRDGSKIALHLVDLDHFKQINDDLGHRAGDSLLALVANRLVETCREIDTVARLGGDEFVILQLVENMAEAQALGERVIKAISIPFNLTKGEVTIGCSIGIVATSGFDAEIESLVETADGALYLSKKLGGNVLSFAPGQADDGEKTLRASAVSLELVAQKA